MEGVTSKAEQVRLAHRKAQRDRCAAKRSATSSFSREETAQRRHQRQKAESDGEAEGAATATLEETRLKYVASLPPSLKPRTTEGAADQRSARDSDSDS